MNNNYYSSFNSVSLNSNSAWFQITVPIQVFSKVCGAVPGLSQPDRHRGDVIELERTAHRVAIGVNLVVMDILACQDAGTAGTTQRCSQETVFETDPPASSTFLTVGM